MELIEIYKDWCNKKGYKPCDSRALHEFMSLIKRQHPKPLNYSRLGTGATTPAPILSKIKIKVNNKGDNKKMNLKDEFKNYQKYFNKCGIELSMLDNELNNYNIILNKKMYQKKNGKYSILLEDETKTIDPRTFACYLSGISFFGDRIEKRYHYLGYIVYRLTCFNPDRTLKRVTTFKYEPKAGASNE